MTIQYTSTTKMKVSILMAVASILAACTQVTADESMPSIKHTTIGAGSTIIQLDIVNTLDISRNDELIYLSQKQLGTVVSPKDSIIVMLGHKVLKHQWVQNALATTGPALAFQSSFLPEQTQSIKIVRLLNGHQAPRQTQQAYAELAVRIGGVLNDKAQYKGGEYVQMSNFQLPSDHTIGDKLFKYEGFGWESDLVAYRYYFDERGAVDVFGKTTNKLVLSQVGLDGTDYHKLNDWGMDVLKVGTSVGLGAVATLVNNEVLKLSAFDTAEVNISNGSLFSSAEMNVMGWQVGEEKHDLTVRYSIAGGSRLTQVSALTEQQLTTWATGIVNHPVAKIESGSKQTESSDANYCYRATFGKQSLNNDNLGMAIFYPCAQVSAAIDTDVNIGVAIKTPVLHYYFMAAWEAETDQFASQPGFVAHLNKLQMRLNNPIKLVQIN